MKRKIVIVAMTLLAAFASVNTYANNDKQAVKEKVAAMTEQQKEQRFAEIKARAEAIKSMDKSALSSEDKKSLRQELKAMNAEARAIGKGGVYISFAGIIVIILLLILIL